MPVYHFTLSIPGDEYLRYYQGLARHVVVESVEGVTVRFPAAKLVRFVTRDGVHGDFRLECDENHRFIKLESLGPSGAPHHGG